MGPSRNNSAQRQLNFTGINRNRIRLESSKYDPQEKTLEAKADEINLGFAILKSACKAPSRNHKPVMFLGRLAHTLAFSEALLEQFFDLSSKLG